MIGGGGAARHEGHRAGTGVQSFVRQDAIPEPGRGAEAEMYRRVRLEAPPIRKAEAAVRHGQVIKMATLNVKSIRKATMHLQVEQYMRDRDIAVLCLQETMVAQTTQYVVGDMLYVMHGHGKEEREYAGVGFVLREDVRRHVTGFELGGDGRIMVMGLDLAPRRLSLVSVYVPQSRREEEERTDFADELGKVIDRCQRKGAALILGDFNARIHARLRGEDAILGPHIYGAGVEKLQSGVWDQGGRTNRDLLMEICAAQDLKVMNTWFKKEEKRKVTHRAPGVEKLPRDHEAWDPAWFAELDLCLAPRRWAGMVKDVEAITWANLNTDHFPLEVTLALKLRAAPRNKKGPGESKV